jgi:hypothetical protein
MAEQPGHDGVRPDPADAAELVELLTFLADWFDSRDSKLLAVASLPHSGHRTQ